MLIVMDIVRTILFKSDPVLTSKDITLVVQDFEYRNILVWNMHAFFTVSSIQV